MQAVVGQRLARGTNTGSRVSAKFFPSACAPADDRRFAGRFRDPARFGTLVAGPARPAEGAELPPDRIIP